MNGHYLSKIDDLDKATQVEPEDTANWYELKEGDIVKFGRISYRVTDLHLPTRTSKLKSLDEIKPSLESVPKSMGHLMRQTIAGFNP
jgi:3-methyladenine DNA glycosylase AlkD